jgi:hypothetical protein
MSIRKLYFLMLHFFLMTFPINVNAGGLLQLSPSAAYESETQRTVANLVISQSNEDLEGFVSENLTEFDKPGMYGVTSVYWAIVSGNDVGLSILLKNGAKVNVVYEDASNPLYWSLMSNEDFLYELLISAGADVNLCDSFKKCESPIFQVITVGNHSKSLSRFKYFYQRGLNIRSKNDKSAVLDRMIYLGRFDMIKYLLLDEGMVLTSEENELLTKYLVIKENAYSMFHPMYDDMNEVKRLVSKGAP